MFFNLKLMTSVCKACKKSGDTFLVCGQCKVTYYCNETCQRNHYGVHRNACGKLKNPKRNKSPGMGFMILAHKFAQMILNDNEKIADLKTRLAKDGSTCIFIVLTPTVGNPDVVIHCVEVNLYCQIRKLDLTILQEKIQTLIPITITKELTSSRISEENFTFYLEKED